MFSLLLLLTMLLNRKKFILLHNKLISDCSANMRREDQQLPIYLMKLPNNVLLASSNDGLLLISFEILENHYLYYIKQNHSMENSIIITMSQLGPFLLG